MSASCLTRPILLAAAAATLTVLAVCQPAAAAPGDLDPSFGAGGRATIDVQKTDFGFAGALTPDGRLLIAGDVNNSSERNAGLARLTPGGAPDPAFGGGSGFVIADPSPAAQDYVENVQLQPDGKVLVGGSFDGSAGILRFRADGLPDTGFSGDGIVKTDFGHFQRAGGVLHLPDGKLLWFGRGDYASGAHDLDLARYHADGSLDASFGSGGFLSHSLRAGSDLEQYHAVLRQPDGKVLIGGEINRGANGLDWTVARLHPDGSFDSSFDGDGRLATHLEGGDQLHDIALQPDGSIVAVGATVGGGSVDIAVVRYLPDGSLDPSFDGDGRRTITLGGDESGRAIALQPDGRIVIAGKTDATGLDDDMIVSRLLPDGSLDPSFGVAGTKLVGFGAGNDEAHDLFVQPDGKLVATGWAVVPGSVDFAAIRLEGDPPASPAPPPPPATTPPADAADRADGAVTVRVLGKRLRIEGRGIARLRLRCPASEASPPCRGRVILRTRAKLRTGKGGKAKRVVLARAGFNLGAGGTKAVKLRLRPAMLRLLRRNARARKVEAIVRVRDAAGNRGTVRKPLRARGFFAARNSRRLAPLEGWIASLKPTTRRRIAMRRTPRTLRAGLLALAAAATLALGASSAAAAALEAQLVHDVNPGPSSSSPNDYVEFGGQLYFSAADGVHGDELWRSNGTSAEIVADIRPGPTGSSISQLTVFGGQLYFRANDGVNGAELWRTDGQTTAMVADINPAEGSLPSQLTSSAGQLYFAADDGTVGRELWRSDGVTTSLVKDIQPGAAGSNPSQLSPFGGQLYMRADDGANGTELWRTDGVTTSLFANINAAAASSNPGNFIQFDGNLYFTAAHVAFGNELWRTDGIGVEFVYDINPGASGSNPSFGEVLAGRLYFSANDGVNGVELWRTDGISTALDADINPGAPSSSPSLFTVFDGQLYFRAHDGVSGIEPWRHDGAAAAQLADINPGPESGSPYELVVHAGFLYMIADDGVHGQEPWKTDGVTTTLFADILQGSDSSDAYEPTRFGANLYITATDGVHGYEVWRFAAPAPAPAPAPPAATGDKPGTADQAVTIRILGKQVRVNRRGVASLRLQCPASEAAPPCRGRVTLRTGAKLSLGKGKPKRVVLGRSGFAVGKGETKTIRVRLGAAKQRLLRSNPRARKLQAIVTVRDGAGNGSTVSKAMLAVAQKGGPRR